MFENKRILMLITLFLRERECNIHLKNFRLNEYLKIKGHYSKNDFYSLVGDCRAHLSHAIVHELIDGFSKKKQE